MHGETHSAYGPRRQAHAAKRRQGVLSMHSSIPVPVVHGSSDEGAELHVQILGKQDSLMCAAMAPELPSLLIC